MKKFLLLFVAVIVTAGVFLFGRSSPGWWPAYEEAASNGTEVVAPVSEPVLWTCPMHPEIRLPDDVPCPKCGMDLVVWKRDGLGPRQLALTAAARALAGVETAVIERRFVDLPVRMVGKVDYDETRVRQIAARVPGRLDRLFVDFTGIRVAQDEHLVQLYSPSLFAAQQELIEAKRRIDSAHTEPSRFLHDSDHRGYEAVRKKLQLWGLSAGQVDAIEARGTAEDTMLIRSPSAGVVIDKWLVEGEYVKEGTPIYRIADLGHLWIQLDAYEQDLAWLRYGQAVEVTAEAVPGHGFTGWISFVDPVVDARKRTVRVRVDVDNSDERLKPGMFVRAIVHARIGGDGQVLEARLAGKWISPMHPEVVKDGPGQCDVCGMDLVPAESLGYVTDAVAEKPLVVPASAVLVTGSRAVVYVLVQGGAKSIYEGREIVLGPRAGDDYIVRTGLTENERVVVHGAFRVDSAMQIQAKPSMMSMRADNTFLGAETAAFRTSLEPVYAAYCVMRRALADDEAAPARAAAAVLVETLAAVDAAWLSRRAQRLWGDEREVMARAAAKAAATDDIEAQRRQFDHLSTAVMALERAFRHDGGQVRYEMFCPMAFDDRGAAWMQLDEDLRNPYFGDAMLHCGEVRSELPGILAAAPVDDVPTEQGTASPMAAGLEPVYVAYFALQAALAGDDAAGAHQALTQLQAAAVAAEVAADAVVGGALRALGGTLTQLPDELAAQRVQFEVISGHAFALHALAGHVGDGPLYRLHCPMAFDDKGADWLQRDQGVRNPYFGSEMPTCGSVKAQLLVSGEER